MNTARKLNVFLLTMINIAVILSIRNLPAMAEYGFSSISYLILVLLCFFIPISLVSAELATGWPKKGGIYVWVKEALGPKIGFLAICLYWIENVLWYPTILSFMAGVVAYAFSPALASNAWYQFFAILTTYWFLTYLNLKGTKFSGWISTFCVITGTLLPGIVLIILGLTWIAMGNPSNISFSWEALTPRLTSFTELAFLTGMLFSFCGMEMSAVHANDVENPQKNYPRAIFYSAFVIITFSILGTLSIAIVLPKDSIDLLLGSITTIYSILKSINLAWLTPVVSILIAIGSLGGVSTWITGPGKGVLAAAERGDLPPFFAKKNKVGMPLSILIVQACIVTIMSTAFVFMPNVSSSYWILTVITSQIYILVYILLFISAIVLRYTHPKTPRTYKVPGKNNIGIWICGILGLSASVFAIVVGFFPPPGVHIGSIWFFEAFLVGGIILSCVLPLWAYNYSHSPSRSHQKAKLK